MASLEQGLTQAGRGLRYSAILLAASVHADRRQLLREAWQKASRLPALLERPLPDALAALTALAVPESIPVAESEITRQIVDAVTAFGAGRPLGLCLRRSLLRYHFLRRAGLPVVVHFGARRFGEDIGGHAWLTLNGQPFHERSEHYRGFTVMYSYPDHHEPPRTEKPELDQCAPIEWS